MCMYVFLSACMHAVCVCDSVKGGGARGRDKAAAAFDRSRRVLPRLCHSAALLTFHSLRIHIRKLA